MAKITVTADRGVSAETLAIAADAIREHSAASPPTARTDTPQFFTTTS